MTTIGEHVEPVKTWNPVRTSPGGTFRYLDIGSIDQRRKTVGSGITLRCADAPSRARQVVAAGDVLVSTVRPNLNAVALVPAHLDGATASTGFTVLRPDATLDSRYLYHWVRSPGFIADMVRQATGAGYPAVSDRIVKQSELPLPKRDEQQRIAAILDQANALRNKRSQVLAHLEDLTQSMFLDMFGDPDIAIREGRVVPLDEVVGDLQGGKSLVAVDSEAKTLNRVLKISAVTGYTFRPSESKPIPDAYQPQLEHFVRDGDLLFSRANTSELVGAVAYIESAPGGLVIPDKLWRFVWRKPDSVEPLYVWALLQTKAMRRELSSRSSGTGGSMKNISKAKLKTLPLPWPSHELQQEFVRALQTARRVALIARQPATDELFASLQTRAFSGRL